VGQQDGGSIPPASKLKDLREIVSPFFIGIYSAAMLFSGRRFEENVPLGVLRVGWFIATDGIGVWVIAD
jgi:hypothetical protein